MKFIKIIILMLLSFSPLTVWCSDLNYKLEVDVNIKNGTIHGKALLNVRADTEVGFSVNNLLNLNINGNPPPRLKDGKFFLTLKKGVETEISYTTRFQESASGLINKNYIILMNHWYPIPDILAEYRLFVTLPKDFIGVSEAETVSTTLTGNIKSYEFQFDHPLDQLHLVASTEYIVQKSKYNNISIETYFFKKDADYAQAYLDHTRKYIAMYEKMLGPYPYKRFAIVENIFPTGYSMPTFTLLGKDVVKLPFIIKTSLGHEFLHEWFGNFVYVDPSHGNWAEGITTYLADHLYADLKKQGAGYRKQIMLDHGAYVNKGNAIKTADFKTRQTRAQKVAGYGKSAMIFHQLKEHYGDQIFFAALDEFIKKNKFRKASWHDIQRAFETITGDRLYSYFGNWLNRKDIPDINVENGQIVVEKGQLLLKFSLIQKKEPYPLRIPISIHYTGGVKKSHFYTKKAGKEIIIPLEEPPLEVIIDENYAIMRELHNDETPPILASLMGADKLIVAVSGRKRSLFKTLVKFLGINNITYIAPDKVTMAMLKENSILIAGYDNQLTDMLLGSQNIPDDGLRLKVYKNPYNSFKRLFLVHLKNMEEIKAAGRNLTHYGKYTELAFNNGKNTHKVIAHAKNGISVISTQATLAVRPDTMATLEDIIPEIVTKRVIYVGEQHNLLSHHINQLTIIKRLNNKGFKFGVGMEMFQVPYQKAINDYIADRINERQFLKETRYFKTWRFDYNLYKPVIDYLKKNKIPLIALNIDGDISRRVARLGMGELTDKEKSSLPGAMDLTNEEYIRDLYDLFAMHKMRTDIKDFNYFLQAQILWDESMAESAINFLKKNPDKKLVVLAGNGHMRNRYGIPKRVFRRLKEPYAVILQDDEIKTEIADFVLLTTKIDGKKAPQMGVKFLEKEETLTIVTILPNGPAMKAGLKENDIITGFDDHPVNSLSDLKIALFFCEGGDKVKVELKRDGEKLYKEITIISKD